MKTKSEALIEGPAEAVREDFDRAPVEPLPRDEDRPLFNDPWEAEAFVLGKLLVAERVVSPREWYEAIGAEIRAAQQRGDPDRGDTYYQHWVNALERVCIDKGIFDRETLDEHTALWGKAVANTPHGVPIELKHAFSESSEAAHVHRHDPEEAPTELPGPIAVFGRDDPDRP